MDSSAQLMRMPTTCARSKHLRQGVYRLNGMKYFIFLIFVTFIISGCRLNGYYLDDTKQDRAFLVEKIQEFSKRGLTSETPILVIDGVEYVNPGVINLRKMKISKRDIREIELLKKDAAMRVFGHAGERGVLLITTNN